MNKKTNLEIKYKEYINPDNATTIVVLHGWGHNSNHWCEFGEILSNNGFNVIIPDLPGFGETELTYEFNLDEYVKVISEFLDELNLGEIILFGHDFGGSISIKIANLNKIEISNLVLNNSTGIYKNNDDNIITKLKKIFNKKSLFKSKDLNKDLEKNILLEKTHISLQKDDITEDIKKINLNTLIIWGEKDSNTTLSNAYVFRKNITKSKLCILNNQKHNIQIDNPKLLIETFLKNI